MRDEWKDGVLSAIARGEDGEQVKMKHKLRLALICALVGVLMVGALALAASRSQILDWLFARGAPNPVAQQLLTQEHASVEADGVRLSLVESLYDRNQLLMTFEVANETGQPLLFDEERMEAIQVTIGGQVVRPETMLYQLVLLGGHIPGVDSPPTCRVTMPFPVPEGLSGHSAQVTLTAHVYRPLAQVKLDDKIKPASSGDEDWIYFGADTLWLNSQGRTNMGDYEAVWQGMQDITDDFTDDAQWDVPLWTGEGLLRAGMAQEAAAPTLSFPITPDPAKQSQGTRVLGQNTFDLPDYTLVVDEMNFTSTGGHVLLNVYPKAPIAADGDIQLLMHPLSRWYALLDENGKDILDDWGAAGSIGDGEDDQGKFRFTLDYKLQPGGDIPKQLTLVPIAPFDDGNDLTREQQQAAAQAHYVLEEAVTVELG